VNKLVLKEATQEYIIYLYQPEGRGDFGEVKLDLTNDSEDILSKPEEDDTGYYAHKAAYRIRQYVKENSFPLHSIQAWY
jgi:hypothetical protein